MKMRIKMFVLALIPLIVLGCSTILLSNSRISDVVTESIENGLQGAAISVRDTLAYAGDGAYSVDESGNLFKGEFNVTEHSEIADHIKESTDMDITIFYGDTRYMTSVRNEAGERVVGTQASEAIIQKVLVNGKEYFSTSVDVVGQPFYGYYIPLLDPESGDVIGMVFSGMPKADALAKISRIMVLLLSINLFLLAICAVVLFFVVGRIVKGLENCVAALDSVSTGKLNTQVDAKDLLRKDEVGKIAKAVKKLQGDLLTIMTNIKKESSELAMTASYLHDKTDLSMEHVKQVEKAMEEIALGAGNQAEETQHATENIILMGNMIEEAAEEISDLNTSAKAIKKRGEVAISTLKELQNVNDKAKGSIDIIYEQTNVTNESAQKIGEAIAIITNIAEETNLLSLNASIEAARAGEQGRGFAVVASQIQKLAEQSNESARQIETIISSLIAESEKAVSTMDEVKEIMGQQNQQVATTDTQVGEVLQEIEQAIVAIEDVSVKTEKINDTRKSVVDTVQNLSAIAEENAASTQETSASATEVGSIMEEIAENSMKLNTVSDQMEQNMAMFEI